MGGYFSSVQPVVPQVEQQTQSQEKAVDTTTSTGVAKPTESALVEPVVTTSEPVEQVVSTTQVTPTELAEQVAPTELVASVAPVAPTESVQEQQNTAETTTVSKTVEVAPVSVNTNDVVKKNKKNKHKH